MAYTTNEKMGVVRLQAIRMVLSGKSTRETAAYKLKTRVKKGLYCSMSEFLGGDSRPVFNHLVNYFGKKTAEELSRLRYGKPKAEKFVMFCGDKEVTETTKKFGKVKVIKNTGHEFTKAYKRAVLSEIL